MDFGEEVEVGEWQSQDVRDRPEMISREIRHCSFIMSVPATKTFLQELVRPNLPWAEDHFQERVSGQPFNPPPSELWWPFRVNNNAAYKTAEQFSHTYPERMWPKRAGTLTDGEMSMRGIRFTYGDLDDVVRQLRKNPLTRQAYLPIWFPEDTGAVSGQRVPCTLGYHFLTRKGKMDIVYYIRSCDVLRHFTDDVYMAARLLQWVVAQVANEDIYPGKLVMHISSLHLFRGDYPMVNKMLSDWDEEAEDYGAAI
jgi:hypothetical protein